MMFNYFCISVFGSAAHQVFDTCSLALVSDFSSDDPFVFSSQVDQVFYVQDGKKDGWYIPVRVRPRDFFDMGREEDEDDTDM